MTTQATREALAALVAERWADYVLPRFEAGRRVGRPAAGTRPDSRSARAALRELFLGRSLELYEELARTARASGARLDFELEHLQLQLLEELTRGCDLCGRVHGVGEVAVVWREHPARVGGMHHGETTRQQAYRLRNVVAACAACAAAIDVVRVTVWRDLMMALRAEPDWVRERFIARAGGSFLPPPAAGNARAAASSHARRQTKGLSTK